MPLAFNSQRHAANTSRCNPFSTFFVQPGAISYLFSTGMSGQRLVEQLEKSHWWGQIVGPHGSGKSTLLAAMLPRLVEAGREADVITLRQRQRNLPLADHQGQWSARTLVVVDGFEQLSWWNRRALCRACRQRGTGLLVTSHRDMGLPNLATTHVTLELAHMLAEQLTNGFPIQLSRAQVERAFQTANGDMRETLFKLFDLYEQERHASPREA